AAVGVIPRGNRSAGRGPDAVRRPEQQAQPPELAADGAAPHRSHVPAANRIHQGWLTRSVPAFRLARLQRVAQLVDRLAQRLQLFIELVEAAVDRILGGGDVDLPSVDRPSGVDPLLATMGTK